jgi:hypothetical protein
MAGLTHERFEALAEAYGGDVSRWPAEVLDAAALAMSAEPAWTRAVLERAARLDGALDAWRPRPPSASLTERILAAAPAAVRRRWPTWLSPAALGAGLAAACAAGGLAGVQVQMHSSEATEVAVTNTLSAISSYDLGEGA